jgi:hypothetical protein
MQAYAIDATHLFRQLHIALLLGRVGRCKQVLEGEETEEKLNARANRVVLVAGLDVAEEDGGAGQFLKEVGQLIEEL